MHLAYRDFKRKVIEIFIMLDMTQFKIKEFWSIQQYDEEGPDIFMTPIRTISGKRAIGRVNK